MNPESPGTSIPFESSPAGPGGRASCPSSMHPLRTPEAGTASASAITPALAHVRPGLAAAPRRRTGYRKARRQRRRTPAALSLNLTAMIDTIFNLLFFFMIASRFGAIEGLLGAHLPAKASATPAAVSAGIPRTPIRIRLHADPATPTRCRATIEQFDETPMEMSALPAALARIHNIAGFDDARVPVYLLAGDEVAWNHVVNAYNAAMSAKYERIFFAGAQ